MDGGILRLTGEQLVAADDYEVADHACRRVHLTDGAMAWAYLAAHPLVAVERRAALLHWAAATNRDLLDPWNALAGRSDLLADGVHPTAEGDEVVWEWLNPHEV